MEFDEYQAKALSTAIYPKDMAIPYCTMKLGGETGETQEKIAKVYRDNEGVFTPEKKEEIKKELGDIMWYIANLAHLFGFSMSEVAQANINKLASRYARGKIHGSGDNR